MASSFGAFTPRMQQIPRTPKVSRFRKTNNSVIDGDLEPPYEVKHDFHKHDDGLIHVCGWVKGASAYVTCCRVRFGPTLVVYDGPSCMKCVLCRGCPACMPDYIRKETMFMGKWETKDGRRLYPFEMDEQHLVNSIKKLIRDEEHFKDNWEDWVECLEAEARLRGIILPVPLSLR